MAYAFDSQDPELNGSIFVEYNIHNRATFTYTNCYLGMFTDFDLGNSIDDYVGSDVGRSMFYCYNGDAFDEAYGTSPGYGNNPPIQGVVLLEGPPAEDDGMDNAVGVGLGESINGTGYGDGVIDNERLGLTGFMYFNNGQGVTSGPNTAMDYYNLMRNVWKDGTQVTYGGTGYDPGSTNYATFMFPGTSDPLGYGTGGVPQAAWSEETAFNNPGDRRGMGASGPFTLGAGQTVSVTYGMVYSRALDGESLELLEDMTDALQTSYDNGNLGGLTPLSVSQLPAREVQATVGPNPVNDRLNITLDGTETVNITLLDAMGKVVAVSQAKGTGMHTVDVEALPAGMYFVQLSDGAAVSNHKILKN